MQRKFITNLAFLLALNLLTKPIWLVVFDARVQNLVMDEQYGMYFALLNFTFLFNILPDMGITNFNTRNIAMNNHMLRKHVPNILSLKLLLGVVYFIVAMGLGLSIGYAALQVELLAWMALNQFLISFVQYLRSNLSGLLLFKQDSIVSVLDRSFMMIICSFFLWGSWSEGFNIRWYVWIQSISYGLTAVVALVLVLRHSGGLKLNFNWPFSIMILKKSLPFALLYVLMSLYNRTDTVMVERLLEDGAEQAGIYAKGYRLLDAVNMFALLFAGLLLPIFSRLLKLKQAVAPIVDIAFRLLGSISIASAVVCFFYAEEIMGALYSSNIATAASIFRLLMMSFVAISLTYIFGTLLTANNNLRYLNIMALFGVVLNIGLNFVLIPEMEAYGSAIATVLTQFLTAFAQLGLALFIFKFKPNWKLLGSLTLFIAGVVAAAYFSKSFHPNWKITIAVLVAISVLWAFLTRFISLKGMLAILQYREQDEQHS